MINMLWIAGWVFFIGGFVVVEFYLRKMLDIPEPTSWFVAILVAPLIFWGLYIGLDESLSGALFVNFCLVVVWGLSGLED